MKSLISEYGTFFNRSELVILAYFKLTTMHIITKTIFFVLILPLFFACSQQKEANYFPEKSGMQGILNEKSLREIRYQPDGESFVIHNGINRFNRSLYGGNTQFRVVAGDVPEFLLFGNGKDGVMRLGIVNGEESKWIMNADDVETRFIPGKMVYTIHDKLLGNGVLELTVLAAHNSETMLVQMEAENCGEAKLISLFGSPSSRHFHRNGDINTESDPDIYYLNANECRGDVYTISNNHFDVVYEGRKKRIKSIQGRFPKSSVLKIVNAEKQASPLESYASTAGDLPALATEISIEDGTEYFSLEIKNGEKGVLLGGNLTDEFLNAESLRKSIAERVKITTPDPYFNTLGGVWTTAADGCWENPTWLHGAIGWRVRLNGWRVEYLGDVLGWHDRARTNFNAYNQSQVTQNNKQLVVPGEKENLSREAKNWESIFYSSGYICPTPNGKMTMKHYDMNLVYIDALLWHLKWTGDLQYAEEVWPVIERHLAWEKRCFDPDDDGLYNAYCCIWASDALEYTGSGVTHSTSYNYRSNLLAAEIAKIIGKNGNKYAVEAEKIRNAMQQNLWLKDKGTFVEFQDALGNKLMHEYPAIWTIYHSIDNNVADAFQNYLMTRYVDTKIPHFNLIGNDETAQLSTISTSNWHPYIWSVNNVAFAEVAHMALAYWQAGRADEAYQLFKANIMDFMYMGTAPGNIGQISYYDAARGEVYSDFSDPAGIGARALIEGLYGIIPDALNGILTIKPGLPSDWKSASVSTPDIDFAFEWNDKVEAYSIEQTFPKSMLLRLDVPAKYDQVESITINGKTAKWEAIDAVGKPVLKVLASELADAYDVKIVWGGKPIVRPDHTYTRLSNGKMQLGNDDFEVLEINDAQNILASKSIEGGKAIVSWKDLDGFKTLFVNVKQNEFSWWQPVNFEFVPPIQVKALPNQGADRIGFIVENNTDKSLRSSVIWVNGIAQNTKLKIPANSVSKKLYVQNNLIAGTNQVELVIAGTRYIGEVLNWNIKNSETVETVNISKYYNARADEIYKQEYLSPRPDVLTLQQPKHGYGNWCNYNVHPELTSSVLEQLGGSIQLENNISFNLGDTIQNIAYTSMYDNYPAEIEIPLNGKAKHAYLMMTGSTNHMQSRVVNGVVEVVYSDGTSEILELKNPENWWSIEQDMHIDDFAFTIDQPSPLRISLKTGEAYTVSKGVGVQNLVDGGMASVLDLNLNAEKELSHLVVRSIANEVVVGVMAVSLQR